MHGQQPPQRSQRSAGHLDYRSRRRSASHHQAHAEPQTHPADTVPDHPLVPRNQPHVIADQPAFDRLLQEVRQAGAFAYDSEFIGEQNFHPRLCVIQIATAAHVALVDPLASLDLSGLWRTLADPTIEKIVHAGLADLEPVQRQCGRPPAGIFDTQVVAGFLGPRYPVSLADLVREHLGVELGKGLKFSQWDQRPLSAVQMRYASDDVRYLPALRQAIGTRLAEAQRTSWAAEECAKLGDPALYSVAPEQLYRRVRGVEMLEPRQLAVLRRLAIWRLEAARQADLPPRTFVSDGVLLSLSRRAITTPADLVHVRGLPRPVERSCGRQLVDLIQEAWSTPPADWPRPLGLFVGTGVRRRADALWQAIQERCAQRNVAPALVAHKWEVTHLLAAKPQEPGDQNPEADRPPRLTTGWRRELLADLLDAATKPAETV